MNGAELPLGGIRSSAGRHQTVQAGYPYSRPLRDGDRIEIYRPLITDQNAKSVRQRAGEGKPSMQNALTCWRNLCRLRLNLSIVKEVSARLLAVDHLRHCRARPASRLMARSAFWHAAAVFLFLFVLRVAFRCAFFEQGIFFFQLALAVTACSSFGRGKRASRLGLGRLGVAFCRRPLGCAGRLCRIPDNFLLERFFTASADLAPAWRRVLVGVLCTLPMVHRTHLYIWACNRATRTAAEIIVKIRFCLSMDLSLGGCDAGQR